MVSVSLSSVPVYRKTMSTKYRHRKDLTYHERGEPVECIEPSLLQSFLHPCPSRDADVCERLPVISSCKMVSALRAKLTAVD